MNRRIAIPVLLLMLFILAGNLAAKEDAQVEKVIKYKVENNAKLIIENVSGWIKIESWDKNEILINYVIRAYGDDAADAEKALQRIKVLSNKSGNQVEVKVKYEKSGLFSSRTKNTNGYVNFDIKLPKDCRIDSSNVSGDTKISNISAEISSATVSGDNIVKSCSGRMEIATVSGNLSLTDHSGKIKANSVSGDLQLTNIDGELTAENVSGDINLTGSKLKNINANTVSGDIIVSTEISDRSDIQLETISGDINFSILNKVALEYSISSFSGDLMLRLPDGKSIVKSKSISGSYDSPGNPKVTLNLNTLSGDITIKTQ